MDKNKIKIILIKFVIFVVALLFVRQLYQRSFCESRNEKMTFNSYFFREEQRQLMYEGYFYPLSYRDIWQEVNLNIYEIKRFDDAILYTLELEQLEVSDPMDEIRMGRRFFGYFYVTADEIYYRPLGDMNGYSDEKSQKVVQEIQENEREFLEKCVVVCCENGTENVADEGGWHQYVEVDGERRIFHLYNDYTSGTREYGQMVWEKGKGLIYYRHGTGGMQMHIELWMLD